MLNDEYLVGKIGLDTEENEPSKVCRYQPTTPPTVIYTALITMAITTFVERFDTVKFGNFQRKSANFRRLALVCIEADFCNQILIF